MISIQLWLAAIHIGFSMKSEFINVSHLFLNFIGVILFWFRLLFKRFGVASFVLRNKALFVVSAEFARLIIYLFKIQAASNTQEIFQRLPFTIQSRSLLSQIFNLLFPSALPISIAPIFSTIIANIRNRHLQLLVLFPIIRGTGFIVSQFMVDWVLFSFGPVKLANLAFIPLMLLDEHVVFEIIFFDWDLLWHRMTIYIAHSPFLLNLFFQQIDLINAIFHIIEFSLEALNLFCIILAGTV